MFLLVEVAATAEAMRREREAEAIRREREAEEMRREKAADAVRIQREAEIMRREREAHTAAYASRRLARADALRRAEQKASDATRAATEATTRAARDATNAQAAARAASQCLLEWLGVDTISELCDNHSDDANSTGDARETDPDVHRRDHSTEDERSGAYARGGPQVLLDHVRLWHPSQVT